MNTPEINDIFENDDDNDFEPNIWIPGKKDIILTDEQDDFLQPLLETAHMHCREFRSLALLFIFLLAGLIVVSILVGYKSEPGLGIVIGVAGFIPWSIVLARERRKKLIKFAETLPLQPHISRNKLVSLLDLCFIAETDLLCFVNACAWSLMEQGMDPLLDGNIIPNHVPPPAYVQCLLSRRQFVSNFDVSGSFRDKQKNVLKAYNSIARRLQKLWPEIEPAPSNRYCQISMKT